MTQICVSMDDVKALELKSYCKEMGMSVSAFANYCIVSVMNSAKVTEKSINIAIREITEQYKRALLEEHGKNLVEIISETGIH